MNQFDFSPDFLLGVISNRYFTVPIYQRSYSWTYDEIEDFWNDALRAIAEDGHYFLGTIVLSEEAEKGTFSIIDGQQRLATTTVLLAAMRDLYRTHGEEQAANAIHQNLSPHDLETFEDKPRLTLNSIDNPFYLEYIVSSRELPTTSESHNRILEAYKFFFSRLKEIIEGNPGTWKTEFGKITKFLNKQAQVIVVKASTHADAFTIFETLNDRGADLTIADLLKNYLFSRAQTELQSVQQFWIEANAILLEYQSEKDFVVFLRHLWSSQHGATRERDLYRKIKDQVSTKTDAVKFSRSIREEAKLYGAILSPESEFWRGYSDSSRQMVESLDSFDLEQNRPLFLAVLQHFTKEEIERTIKFMVSWSVRGIISGGIGGGKAERYICDAAVSIRSGHTKTKGHLQDKLSPITSPDSLFYDSFKNFRTTTNKFARYLLLAIERHLQGNHQPELIPNQDVEEVNLEHILPRKPKDGDWESFTMDEAGVFANRVGNMTLLKKSSNAKIGNKPWPDKQLFLAKSSLLLNKKLVGCSDWTKNEIDERQDKMASMALKIWTI